MGAIVGILMSLILVFGPITLVCKVAEKTKPDATVGEVGPYILGIYAIELLFLFALIGLG